MATELQSATLKLRLDTEDARQELDRLEKEKRERDQRLKMREDVGGESVTMPKAPEMDDGRSSGGGSRPRGGSRPPKAGKMGEGDAEAAINRIALIDAAVRAPGSAAAGLAAGGVQAAATRLGASAATVGLAAAAVAAQVEYGTTVRGFARGFAPEANGLTDFLFGFPAADIVDPLTTRASAINRTAGQLASLATFKQAAEGGKFDPYAPSEPDYRKLSEMGRILYDVNLAFAQHQKRRERFMEDMSGYTAGRLTRTILEDFARGGNR